MKLLKTLSSVKISLERYLLVLIIAAAIGAVFALPNARNSLDFFKNVKNNTFGDDLPSLQAYPVRIQNWQSPPQILAKSAVVIDAKTGVALYEKDPNIRHLPASTTKLMTALVSLERCSPQTVISIITVNEEGTQMGLEIGDQVTVETLLYGLLVSSGNDAAYALATACQDSVKSFVASMNQKAKELSMYDTHFDNPAGFDSPQQYSTARDLAKLAKVAVASPLIAKIVKTKSIVLTDVGSSKTYYLENINKLLGEVEGIEGVKTGQTEGSLEILVTKTTRNEHTIIVSILGSYDRFGESKKLIEWAFANHTWLNP